MHHRGFGYASRFRLRIIGQAETAHYGLAAQDPASRIPEGDMDMDTTLLYNKQ